MIVFHAFVPDKYFIIWKGSVMKYKICPRCGMHNSPTAFDCEACYTDLTGVRITDEQAEASVQPAVVKRTTVRICGECGFTNPANARKCLSCGEDISDIAPTEEPEQQLDPTNAEPHFVLVSIDGQFSYELQHGKTIVGREAEMSEYLKNKVFVSRRHAELTLEDDRLTIQNLSRSNFTFINNNRSVSETEELHDGDELGLGGNCRDGRRQDNAAYFTVRIKSCT